MRLLGANLAIIIFVSAAIWLQLSRSFDELGAAAGTSGAEAEFYHRYLEYHAHSLRMSLLLAFGTAIALSTFLTLVISHRFSGPMVRLRGYFRDLMTCSGPVPRLSFRKHDFLDDLPPLVNEAIDHIQKRDQQERKSA
jgi:hypothetical protein